jgi:hypothetical protein
MGVRLAGPKGGTRNLDRRRGWDRRSSSAPPGYQRSDARVNWRTSGDEDQAPPSYVMRGLASCPAPPSHLMRVPTGCSAPRSTVVRGPLAHATPLHMSCEPSRPIQLRPRMSFPAPHGLPRSAVACRARPPNGSSSSGFSCQRVPTGCAARPSIIVRGRTPQELSAPPPDVMRPRVPTAVLLTVRERFDGLGCPCPMVHQSWESVRRSWSMGRDSHGRMGPDEERVAPGEITLG